MKYVYYGNNIRCRVKNEGSKINLCIQVKEKVLFFTNWAIIPSYTIDIELRDGRNKRGGPMVLDYQWWGYLEIHGAEDFSLDKRVKDFLHKYIDDTKLTDHKKQLIIGQMDKI